MKLNDKKFFKYVKNTLEDFLNQEENDTVKNLQSLLNSKELTLLSIYHLALIIQTRIDNFECIKSIQDTKTFSIVNKEHKYMKAVLERYFVFHTDDSSPLLAITKKK